MSAEYSSCRSDESAQQDSNVPASKLVEHAQVPESDSTIVDHKVTLLIAAGATMAANCEPCLNKVIPDLIEAGVCGPDIRTAVEIGQFVKDRPAAVMKQAADVLAGTRLSEGPETKGCPAKVKKQAASPGARAA